MIFFVLLHTFYLRIEVGWGKELYQCIFTLIYWTLYLYPFQFALLISKSKLAVVETTTFFPPSSPPVLILSLQHNIPGAPRCSSYTQNTLLHGRSQRMPLKYHANNPCLSTIRPHNYDGHHERHQEQNSRYHRRHSAPYHPSIKILRTYCQRLHSQHLGRWCQTVNRWRDEWISMGKAISPGNGYLLLFAFTSFDHLLCAFL